MQYDARKLVDQIRYYRALFNTEHAVKQYAQRLLGRMRVDADLFVTVERNRAVT